MAQAQKEFSVVGKRIPRIDAYERVTGQAQYTGDIQLPGMLYARVLRSPHPHAKIVSIDTSKAEKLPGVKAVIHHGNAQVPWSSGGHTHPRFIFNNPVRFVGDAVAAVAATDRHIAEEALGLIDVKYEKIPHVLDPNEALKPDAPKISTDGNLSVGKGNFSAPIEESWGDLEQGFKEADRVFEDTYITKHTNNAQLERRVSVAKWDAGKLTVFASTQGVSNARTDIAQDFGLPLSKVRVVSKYMGGGFGNKNQAQDYDYMAAVLAKVTSQPVKLEFTREDDYIGMHGRWSSEQHYKIGVKKDGTITAVQLDAVTNMGAYRKQSGNLSGTDFYQIPNFKKLIKPVRTNTVVAANYRAPAYPQSVFGFASFLDQIAYELGINPLDMFMRTAASRAATSAARTFITSPISKKLSNRCIPTPLWPPTIERPLTRSPFLASPRSWTRSRLSSGSIPSRCSKRTGFRNTRANFPSRRIIWKSASSKDRSASAGMKNGTNLVRCPIQKSMASVWPWVAIHSDLDWARRRFGSTPMAARTCL